MRSSSDGFDLAVSERLLGNHLRISSDSDSLVDGIVLTIAKEIIEGRIPPGSVLDSISLAKRFQTSRTPIREALFALDRQGLVEAEPRRRARVSSFSATQIAEIYQLRAELHGLIARKVARRAEADDLVRLGEALDAMRRAHAEQDADRYFWGNVLFHDLAADIAGDETLKRVTYGLGLQVLRLRHATMVVPERMGRSLNDHSRLLEAYTEHDADLAVALSRALVLNALPILLRAVDPSAHVEA